MSPEAVWAKPQWNAYGPPPDPMAMRADRPTWPNSSPPSTSPSLKGILKKAKNDEKSWLGPAMDVSSIEMDGYKTSKPENEELWDPGGDPQRTRLINIALSSPLHALLSTTNTCDRESDESSDDNEDEESMSRTDLDSHANMAVVGRHAYILSDTGRTADVNPFTPDYESMQVPIIDAAMQYECPIQWDAPCIYHTKHPTRSIDEAQFCAAIYDQGGVAFPCHCGVCSCTFRHRN